MEDTDSETGKLFCRECDLFAPDYIQFAAELMQAHQLKASFYMRSQSCQE